MLWVDVLLLSTPIAFALCFYKSETIAIAYPFESALITAIQLLTVAIMAFVWTLFVDEFPLLAKNQKVIVSILVDWRALGGLLYNSVITTAWSSFIEQEGNSSLLQLLYINYS